MKHPSYKICMYLKKAGYPLQGAEYYYFNKDHKIYSADKIVKFAGWERLYIAAPTDPELNRILPAKIDGASLFMMKHKSGLYSAGYTDPAIPLIKGGTKGGCHKNPIAFHSISEVEAKAMLVKYLLYKKIITLEK